MTLWQLKAFATVAKEGSFTKAGKVLSISQPSVSTLVIGLEKELKVKLFEKLGVRPHLTEAGSRLLKLAETVLSTVDKIPDEMEQVSGLKKGKISIGSAGVGTPQLLPAIEVFKSHHPGIDVALTIQNSEGLHQKLLDGELDVAILGRPPRSRLIVGKPYREEEVVVIASPNHSLTKKRCVSLKLLADQPLITYERGTPIRDIVEKRFTEEGLPFKAKVEVNLQLGSRDAIRGAVSNGLGIGFLTKGHVIADLKAGRVKILKVPELKLKRIIYVAFHKNRKSPLVQAFVDFLWSYK